MITEPRVQSAATWKDLAQTHGAVSLVDLSTPERRPLKGMPARLSVELWCGACTGGQRDYPDKQLGNAKLAL